MYTQRKLYEAKQHARRGVKPLATTLAVCALVLSTPGVASAGTWTRHARVLASAFIRH